MENLQELMKSILTRNELPKDSDTKIAEISGENLEELLAYDDLFLDYFNQFLVSSVFPWRINYNRFTGTFEEMPSEFGEFCQSMHPLKYGATDREREKMLEWARERRLNFFLGSQLFRELKLCKQLLRPLDDQRTAGSQESSQMIRGYSRQTGSCVSSLSNGIGQSLEPDAEAFLHTNLPFSAPMPRQIFYSQNSSLPSDRAVVDDGYLTSCTQKDRDTLMTNSRTPKSAVSSLKKNTLQSPHLKKPVPSHVATSSSSSMCHSALSGLTPKSYTKIREVTFSRENTMLSYNCDSEANKEIVKKTDDDSSVAASKLDLNQSIRALSAPVNYRDFLRIAWFSRFDVLFGMPTLVENDDTYTYLQFHDGGNSDVNTDMDVRNMEGRLQMTLQEVKEHILGSYHGMQQFKDFLANTAGCHLVKFWLHCELFRDCMEDQDDQNFNRNRNQLFRDIQSKYKMSLTQEAREEIQRASTNVSLHHSVFIRTQYDVLRRLRSYWVPRFLLHLERNTDTLPSLSSSRRTTPKWLTRNEHYGSVHLPSVSISRLPLFPVSVWGNSHVTKISDNADQQDAECQLPEKLKDGSNRFLIALTNDRKFGGPFRQYLTRKKCYDLLRMLSFWEDVTDYGSAETKTNDQYLQHVRAWDIYHNYIANHDKQNIQICNKVRDTIYNSLLNMKDSISASIFNPVKEEVVVCLEAAWKKSLQEDLKNYLDCKTRAQGGTPPSNADAIEISLQDGKLVIKRPNPWIKRNVDVSNDQFRQWSSHGKINILELDEEEKRLRRCQILEEKRRRDRNRKQAIRAAHKRRQEEKLMALKVKQEPQIPSVSRSSNNESPSLPTFKDFLDNKPVISSFKKCIHGVQNGPQVSHMINLYSEIENLKGLMASSSSKSALITKKADLANHIQKTYLNENSTKCISLLSENGHLKLIGGDGAINPDSEVIDFILEKITEKIENAFGTFLMTRSDDAGISEEELTMMSPADLVTILTKTEKDEIAQVTKKPIGQRKKLKQDWTHNSISDFLPQSSKADDLSSRGVKYAGQAVASRDDHLEFRHALQQCISGQLNLRMIYFHIYLKKHAEEDHLPFLDKDLFFYIECQKAKESLIQLFDENERKKRIQNLLENYLQSESTPLMKVDLSQDVHQRTLKMVQQCLSSKEYDPAIFDEAQAHIFKELVPYWAGFRKSHQLQNNTSQNQQKKPQKLLRIHDDSLKKNVFLPKQVILPSIPHSTVRVLSFSLADGAKWRPASSLCSMHLSTTSSPSKNSEQR